MFSAGVPVTAVDFDQRLAYFEIDNAVMDFNLLLELNTVFGQPFGNPPLDAAWLAAQCHVAKGKLAFHGWGLFIQAIPGVVAIGIAKRIAIVGAALELLDRFAAVAAWHFPRCTYIVSIALGVIGTSTFSRAISTFATRECHKRFATSLTYTRGFNTHGRIMSCFGLIPTLFRAGYIAPLGGTDNGKRLAALYTYMLVGFDFLSAYAFVAAFDRAEALTFGLAGLILNRVSTILTRFDRHIFLTAMRYMPLYHNAVCLASSRYGVA